MMASLELEGKTPVRQGEEGEWEATEKDHFLIPVLLISLVSRIEARISSS